MQDQTLRVDILKFRKVNSFFFKAVECKKMTTSQLKHLENVSRTRGICNECILFD